MSLITLHNQKARSLVILDATALENLAKEWAFDSIEVTYEESSFSDERSRPWPDSL